MSSVVLSGDSSGQVTLTVPSAAGSNTATVPAQTGTLQMLGQGTAVATTSGTSVTFTGIPSWVKRITVMLNGVSTSGTSNILIQLGSGSVTTTGYVSSSTSQGPTNAVVGTSATNGLVIFNNSATNAYIGLLTICLVSSNSWTSSHCLGFTNNNYSCTGAGIITLGGTLDRVVLTTVNGTDTFDAGSVNILYEG